MATQCPPPVDVLLIGDSIACGYTSSEKVSEPSLTSRGYLDAFPAVAQRLLCGTPGENVLMAIRTIAYPGMLLTNPMGEEAEGGSPAGMIDKFFHVSFWQSRSRHVVVTGRSHQHSPWDELSWSFDEHPSTVIIALGKSHFIFPDLISLSSTDKGPMMWPRTFQRSNSRLPFVIFSHASYVSSPKA